MAVEAPAAKEPSDQAKALMAIVNAEENFSWMKGTPFLGKWTNFALTVKNFISVKVVTTYEQPEIVAVCAAPKGDGTMCNKETRLSFDGKIQLANLKTHFVGAHGYLLPADIKDAVGDVGEAASAAAASAAASDAAPRVGTEEEREMFVQFIAMGGLPMALVENPAWLWYAGKHNIPVSSRRTLGRTLEDMRERLIDAPLRDLSCSALLCGTSDTAVTSSSVFVCMAIFHRVILALGGGPRYLSSSISVCCESKRNQIIVIFSQEVEYRVIFIAYLSAPHRDKDNGR